MFSKIAQIKFVLGSQSPRRQQLFSQLGLHFIVKTADIEEPLIHDDLASNTEHLAMEKAKAIDADYNDCLITADTLVGLEGKILGKPKNMEEARTMIRSLGNKWHEVITGVCISYQGKYHTFHEKTSVLIKEISDEDLTHYAIHGNPMDKAGSYGIQDWFGLTHVEAIKGCYYNVMGFPMPRFYKELKEILK